MDFEKSTVAATLQAHTNCSLVMIHMLVSFAGRANVGQEKNSGLKQERHASGVVPEWCNDLVEKNYGYYKRIAEEALRS
ncbi:hypothetical protein DSO57_1019163 [Entomophthora muscae]|uniref:Uncharacterized protein n=1 Tax=Entomophthora muscae TaxID=34485 RepID=A0ACC2RVB8_9FUNG|nr:hypothetical protein DSO57_1019163 [Entomophthora muscae]